MTVIVPPGVSPTGERIVREIEGVGTLVFENYGPGEWVTKKGEPAKKGRRRYLLGDDEFDSVSSITGTLDKYAIRVFIEREATHGAVLAERQGELRDVDPDDWTERVKLLGLGATAKKEEGADRGTAIHMALHALATEGRAPNPADFTAVARPWVRGAMRLWLALRPEMVAAEQIVCDPEHRFAGRFDLLARCDGALTLLDYKTGKGRVFDEAHYQTRLYAMALAAEGVEVERILILGIGDDGGFEPVECEATEADALALLHTFRSRKRINAGMASQRAAAKAAMA